MNEFGEIPSIYIWPEGHVEGEAFPEDFWDKVTTALEANGINWETV